jgi:hypothetical protein
MRFLLLYTLLAVYGSLVKQLPPNMYPDTAFAPFTLGVGSFDPDSQSVL